MSNQKSLNHDNSSIRQMCLDAASLGFPQFLDALLELEKAKPNLAKEIDAEFARHKYPEDRLKWVKLKNFENCRALSQLSSLSGGDKSKSILLLIIQNIAQNLIVQISIRDICQILNMSKPTVIKSINQLIEYGFICIVKESTNKDSAIYMVNPDIVLLGNANEKQLRDDFEWYVSKYDKDLKSLFKYYNLSTIKINVSTSYNKFRDENGDFIIYNSFIINEKKPTTNN